MINYIFHHAELWLTCAATANQLESWTTVSLGVFAGANSPHQGVSPYSLYPASATVGTSGSASTRVGQPVASTRSLRALTCSTTVAELSYSAVTWPPSRPVTAGALPGKRTSVMLT